MANTSTMIAIKDVSFKEGFSYSLIWIFINYNIVMQWINIDEWVKTYNHYDKPTKHNIFFLYILFKIYSNTIVCLVLLLIVLIIIYFLILKMLSFDSGLFNRLVNGDKNVIKEFLPEKNKDSTEITTKDLFDMIFSSILMKTNFMIQHLFIVIVFSVLFSMVISSYKYFSNKDNRKVNLHVYFIMLFIMINYHFSYTRFLQ
jgi:hypothetical protein